MFNRLPGAMLTLGHTHQWKKGFNCCPVLSQDTSSAGRLVTATFNPAPPVAGLTSVSWLLTSVFLPSPQCAPYFNSPASIRTASRFSFGGNGQVAYGVKAHGGL